MKFVNYSEASIHSILAEAKSILNNKEDINIEKETLTNLMYQADFILEKNDHIYDQFIDVFTSMGQFDFSKRLTHVDNGDNFINFVVNGLNMINEEFEVKAIHKNVIQCLLGSLEIKDTFIVLTNPNGFIYLTAGNAPIENFNPRYIQDQSIRVLFSNYDVIEDKLKVEGSAKNISVVLKWKEELIPTKVDVTLCTSKGKIESVIYLIKS